MAEFSNSQLLTIARWAMDIAEKAQKRKPVDSFRYDQATEICNMAYEILAEKRIME